MFPFGKKANCLKDSIKINCALKQHLEKQVMSLFKD